MGDKISIEGLLQISSVDGKLSCCSLIGALIHCMKFGNHKVEMFIIL